MLMFAFNCISSIYGMFLSSFLYVLSTIMKAVEVYALAGPGKADHVQRYHYTAYADSVGIKIGKFHLDVLCISINLLSRRY